MSDCSYCKHKPSSHENHKSNENNKSEAVILCKLPGCTRSVYIEKNGKVHGYCCKEHAISDQSKINVKGNFCLFCKSKEKCQNSYLHPYCSKKCSQEGK